MARHISATIEFVGGPDCGDHRVITITPDGLPATVPDEHGVERYMSAGELTVQHRRHRYDWQAEHTGKRSLPEKCCGQPHRGCPLYLRRPGSTP